MNKLIIFAFCLNTLLALMLFGIAGFDWKLGREFDFILCLVLALVNAFGAFISIRNLRT